MNRNGQQRTAGRSIKQTSAGKGARCTPKEQRTADRTKGINPDQGNGGAALIKTRPKHTPHRLRLVSPVRAAPVVMSAYIRQKENCKPVLGCTNSHRTYKKDN